jgi:hypothetical protein
MGFTASTGQPVMCVIIFSSESTKGIPGKWITRFDTTKINSAFNIPEDKEDLVQNVRESEEVVLGGTTYTFQNKILPCFVSYSPNGGITPTILSNCLETMDQLDFFPRTNGNNQFCYIE